MQCWSSVHTLLPGVHKGSQRQQCLQQLRHRAGTFPTATFSLCWCSQWPPWAVCSHHCQGCCPWGRHESKPECPSLPRPNPACWASPAGCRLRPEEKLLSCSHHCPEEVPEVDAPLVALLHPLGEGLGTSQTHQLSLPCSTDRSSSLHTLLHCSFFFSL